jgi:hypothetical protein
MAANRRNNTGPRTAVGKLRSRYNALRHVGEFTNLQVRQKSLNRNGDSSVLFTLLPSYRLAAALGAGLSRWRGA